MNLSSINAGADLGGQALQRLAGDSSVPESEKLGRVAQQFEAYLLRQYLAEARKTLVESRFNPDARNNQIYQDMITTQLADTLSTSGAIGLAASLKEQLVREGGLGDTATKQPETPEVQKRDKHE